MVKKTAPIKLIVTDVDGTLLNSQHQLAERTEKALKAAIEQGVLVALATGKTRGSVNDIVKRLGLKTPGIFVQGLVIAHPDGSEQHLGTLDPKLLRRVLTFTEERGFQTMAYSGRRILVRAMTAEARIMTEQYDEPLPEVVGPLVNQLDELPLNKVIFCGREAKHITALRWQLAHLVEGSARLTQALPDALELLPYGASKATALKLLLKDLKLTPEEVLAIGDGENDIEMIQLVGLGVAMGNANPKLKAVADAVVASNDADGVAEAVEKYVLKPAQPTETAKPITVAAAPAPAAEKPAAPAPTADKPADAAPVTADKPAAPAADKPAAPAAEKPTEASKTE
jgi:Cof subfamily protein (haloacid dehalogenase superfamily)